MRGLNHLSDGSELSEINSQCNLSIEDLTAENTSIIPAFNQENQLI